jgi:hypothetical protein
MNNHKNILIIKSGKKSGVGEQFIESMFSHYPKSSLFRYNLISDSSSFPLISSLCLFHFIHLRSKSEIKKIKKIIIDNDIQIIWVFLNAIDIIELYRTLLPNINIPFVVHIWDTPEYLTNATRLDFFSKKIILKYFNNICEHSSYIITTSKPLSNWYSKKYKKPTNTLYFITLNPILKKKIHHDNISEIKIIFAGSLYAYKEWKYFLRAIEKYNRESITLKIFVTFIGTPSRWTYMPDWITFMKPINPTDALNIISQSDIAYLPYWMDKKYKESVRFAFPSKLSFYASAGTPIFFHGPKHSAPSIFLESTKIGLTCSYLDHKKILEKLFLLLDKNFINFYNKNRYEVYQKFFSPDKANLVVSEVLDSLNVVVKN